MSGRGARDWYCDGVRSHYEASGAMYANPHAPVINDCVRLAVARWPLGLNRVLDLAAGAGELTLALHGSAVPAESHGRDARATNFSGIDPYTFEAYERATGLPCERLTFEQIAAGALRGRSYSLIGCSFALHLAADSLLPQLCLELAQIAPRLLILTPHKRPTLRADIGWDLLDEFAHERVRTRLYASRLLDATLPAP